MRETMDWIRTAVLAAALLGSVWSLSDTIATMRTEIQGLAHTNELLRDALHDLSSRLDTQRDRADTQRGKDLEQDARLNHQWDVIRMLRRAHDLE